MFADEALTMFDAWRAYDTLFDDPRTAYAKEPDGIESLWRSHTELQSFSPKVWNDAYLAAFAETADLDLVTFDRGFAQYRSVRCTILS